MNAYINDKQLAQWLGREKGGLVWRQVVGPSLVGLPMALLGPRSILLYSARPSFRMLIPNCQNKVREFMLARPALLDLFKGAPKWKQGG